MKYKNNFNRDFSWYIKVRNEFKFDGRLPRDIIYDREGIDGKKAFFIFDSQGQLKPTKHPELLRRLLLTKGSINLHIKMYAEDRAKGVLPKILFDEICEGIESPDWFEKAVEKQKIRHLKKEGFWDVNYLE